MNPSTHTQNESSVILSLSDKVRCVDSGETGDRRRTSTSTACITSVRSTLTDSESGLLLAAICYLIASYRLLITVY